MGIINASYRRHHIANKMTSQCDVRVFERSMTVSREIFLPLGYRFLDGWQNQLLNDHLHLGIDMFESEAKHVYLICKEDENIRRVIHRGRKRDSILRLVALYFNALAHTHTHKLISSTLHHAASARRRSSRSWNSSGSWTSGRPRRGSTRSTPRRCPRRT